VLEGLFAVTGGGSGIGAGCARALRAAGAEVAVLDIDAHAARTVAEEVGGSAYELDVAKVEAVEALFTSFGRLRGLVNCAGVVGAITPIVAYPVSEWRRVLAVHLDGTFLCTQAAARNMLAHGTPGTIVNTSSVNAQFGHRGLAAYSAAKAGISMLTKIAALELAAAGIRVNAVAPGIVATGMTADLLTDEDFVRPWVERNPFGRIGQPADVADVVVFLAGEQSRWITGQTLTVDGGTSLRVEPPFHPDGAWSVESLRARIGG
jgi:NAD(P)-dependent dehydrogenase (short-subunit alcohol dehydrogenase family)